MAAKKLEKALKKQVRVVTVDGRHLVGTLLAYDGHMNVVLDETQEFRKSKKGDEMQRAVGLVILRGESIVSTILESSYSGARPQTSTRQPIRLQLT